MNLLSTAARVLAAIFRNKEARPSIAVPVEAAVAISKRSRKRSRLANYKNAKTGGSLTVLHLTPDDAEVHCLAAGDKVKVLVTSEGLCIRPADKGATITLVGDALRIQAGGLHLAPMPTTPIQLSKGVDGDVIVSLSLPQPANDNGSGQGNSASPAILPPAYLQSLVSLRGRAGAQRLKLLAGNDNVKQALATTNAGDECYTPRFLIDLILTAARRVRFCADFCSMREDGRYDLDLSQDLVEHASVEHPRDPSRRLPVIGHVPADKHFTKDATEFGSLLLEWWCLFGWLNPPYTRRLWAVFLEKAAREVAAGRAKTIVALVPMDTFGEHIRHMFDENAYRIELSRRVPFFMRSKTKTVKETGEGVVVENTVETIKGNALVVFGKGAETRDFLLRLVDGLRGIDYITEEQARHYREQYQLSPRLNAAA